MSAMKFFLTSLRQSWGRKSVIGIPYIFLILFFSLPFLIVFKLSISDMDGIRFKDLLDYADGVVMLRMRVSNYLFLMTDSLYVYTYWYSIKLAALNTAICLAIGYPFAYFMARA
ncbi:MAG: putrescine ABC transporter permease PotH, partial [Burkholderiaceae bacterium]|nr:putrescine ABC transporter permease PotH [Burkholderiaceae bacterium]